MYYIVSSSRGHFAKSVSPVDLATAEMDVQSGGNIFHNCFALTSLNPFFAFVVYMLFLFRYEVTYVHVTSYCICLSA